MFGKYYKDPNYVDQATGRIIFPPRDMLGTWDIHEQDPMETTYNEDGTVPLLTSPPNTFFDTLGRALWIEIDKEAPN